MNILLAEAELSHHAHRQTELHIQAYSRFSRFYKSAFKSSLL